MTDLKQLSGLVASIEDRIAKHESLGRVVAAEWKEFGKAVSWQRALRGISIRKMALAAGMTKSSLCRRELGQEEWTVAEARRAIRYFEAVKVPVEEVEAP